jgi:NAD+ synthase
MTDLSLNYEVLSKFLIYFIKEEVQSNKFNKVVLGLSGGVDSAVVAYLSVEALGKENVIGILMPYKLSSPDSLNDALLIAKKFGIKHETFEITDIVDQYFQKINTTDKIRIGNFLSRIRMSILFDRAREYDAIVMGTGNKSEIMLGYTTWYGDMAAGLYPIGDLYKTQVFELAKFMKIPEKILKKPPSADLWPGQKDEDELGALYTELDAVLYLYIDERKSMEEIISLGHSKKLVQNVIRRVNSTQFKRTIPPVAKFSARTFGIDFLYPHDMRR